MKATIGAIVLVAGVGILTNFFVSALGAWKQSDIENVISDVDNIGKYHAQAGERYDVWLSNTWARSIAVVSWADEMSVPKCDIPSWTSLFDDSRPTLRGASGRMDMSWEVASGWPFRSFRTACHVAISESGSPIVDRRGVIDLYGGWTVAYRPIYPRCFANTAIYGSVWWVLLFGPGIGKRWRRRRAGRCPKCGYDLRASESDVCPECGAGAVT